MWKIFLDTIDTSVKVLGLSPLEITDGPSRVIILNYPIIIRQWSDIHPSNYKYPLIKSWERIIIHDFDFSRWNQVEIDLILKIALQRDWRLHWLSEVSSKFFFKMKFILKASLSHWRTLDTKKQWMWFCHFRMQMVDGNFKLKVDLMLKANLRVEESRIVAREVESIWSLP